MPNNQKLRQRRHSVNAMIEIQKNQQPSPADGIKSLVAGYAEQFAKTLPAGITGESYTRFCLTALTKTPALMSCTPESVMGCLLTLAGIGLVPDGRHAHLIPYGNACTLILDYKGIIELMKQSGEVVRVHADVVRENDEFAYSMGEVQRHSYQLGKDRGKAIGAYAFAKIQSGDMPSIVMDVAEIEAIRAKSKAKNSGPWVDFWDEMAKKTCVRRLSKYLSIRPDVAEAIDKDEEFHSTGRPTRKVSAREVPADPFAEPAQLGSGQMADEPLME